MTIDLYIDLQTGKLVRGLNDRSTPDFPVLVQGDTYRVAIHGLEPVANATSTGSDLYVEVPIPFATMRLAIGRIDAAPTSGTYKIRVNDPAIPDNEDKTTAEIPFDAGAEAIAAAINALSAVTELNGEIVVSQSAAKNIFVALWEDVAGEGIETPLEIVDNALVPDCFRRVIPYPTDAGLRQIIKLFHQPVAFTDTFALPALEVPDIEVPREGSDLQNEIQSLKVPDPAKAVETFALVFAGLRTRALSVAGLTADQIQDALDQLYPDERSKFSVSDVSPATGKRREFQIEFIDTLKLSDQPEIEVEPLGALVAEVPTATLSLLNPGLEIALDGKLFLDDLLLELVVKDGDGKERTLLSQVKVRINNDMIDAAMVEYHRPAWEEEGAGIPEDEDYPLMFGTVSTAAIVGDAVHQVYDYGHGLGTSTPCVFVFDLSLSPTQRVPDDQYTTEVLTANTVRLSFMTTPSAGRYKVVVINPEATTVLNSHHHAISDIEGLQAILNSLAAAGNPLDLWPQIPASKLPDTIPASKLDLGALVNLLKESSAFQTMLAGLMLLSTIIEAIGTKLRESTEFLETLKAVFANSEIITSLVANLKESTEFKQTVREEVLGAFSSDPSGISSHFRRIPDFSVTVPRPSSYAGGTFTQTFPTKQIETISTTGKQVQTEFTGVATREEPESFLIYAPLSRAKVGLIDDGTKSNVVLDPDEAAIGKFYTVTGAGVSASAVAGRDRVVFKEGDKITYSDGHWYAIRLIDGVWYPVECELKLCTLTMSESQLGVGDRWNFSGGPSFVLDGPADGPRPTGAGELVLEWAPIPAGGRLTNLVWRSLLRIPIRITDAPTSLIVALQVDRTGPVAFTASARLGAVRTAWQTTTADFAVRLSFGKFSIPDEDPAGGALTVALTGATDSVVEIPEE